MISYEQAAGRAKRAEAAAKQFAQDAHASINHHRSPKMNWVFDDKPAEVGIYAVTICWDVEEGMFPEVDTWDGKAFSRYGAIVIAHSGPFSSMEDASNWAWENDMEA